MKILFLTHGFNALSQRLYVELSRRGHEVSVEFDINDAVTEEAVALFQPALIVAPFLKRAIPETIWQRYRCIIIHPGIPGDRGPASLDRAIMRNEGQWGVTCLQASAELDAGDIWASCEFPMRPASKSSLYRQEVTEAAVTALLQTLARIEGGSFKPQPLDYRRPEIRGRWHGPLTQAERAIDWQRDSTARVLTKIRAADSMPGLRTTIAGRDCYLYNAWQEGRLGAELQTEPGSIIASRDGAICLATIDGAIWVTHLRLATPAGEEPAFKLPATCLLAPLRVPEVALPCAEQPAYPTLQEIRYRELNGVGYLYFDFYNGAMDAGQCGRLRQALADAKQRPIRVLVLFGGSEFWSNGIHLNRIEAAPSPADESWCNINAMNDLCLELIDTPDQQVIAALRGNAAAGGVFMALAADRVLARAGVVLNPHYKSMGNLYGSEYWTYLLPKRVGPQRAAQLMQNRLPLGAPEAAELGLLDACIDDSAEGFVRRVMAEAQRLAADPGLPRQLQAKRLRRAADEAKKPLQQYRDEEMAQLQLNFYGFDPSYHVARYHFVEKLAKARTPAYLASHRRLRLLR